MKKRPTPSVVCLLEDATIPVVVTQNKTHNAPQDKGTGLDLTKPFYPTLISIKTLNTAHLFRHLALDGMWHDCCRQYTCSACMRGTALYVSMQYEIYGVNMLKKASTLALFPLTLPREYSNEKS